MRGSENARRVFLYLPLDRSPKLPPIRLDDNAEILEDSLQGDLRDGLLSRAPQIQCRDILQAFRETLQALHLITHNKGLPAPPLRAEHGNGTAEVANLVRHRGG